MKKRHIIIPVLIVAAAVAIWFLAFYQPVYTAKMSELTRPRQDGFQIGPARLGWSMHTKNDGYIYLRDMFGGGNKPLWGIAITKKTRLSEVNRKDLQCIYYGLDDSRGTNVFGSAWDGYAVLLPKGRIFFARLVTNPSVVYAIQLADQKIVDNEGQATIRYRVFRHVPPGASLEPIPANSTASGQPAAP